MLFFDREFVIARVNECIAICENHKRYGFDNPQLFIKAFEKGLSWLNNYGLKVGLMPLDICDLKDQFYDFYRNYLKVHDEKNQPVSKPAAPAQMPVLRLLGQRFTTYPLCNQNKAVSIPLRFWFTRPVSIPVTKQFLSNFRSVGGLA